MSTLDVAYCLDRVRSNDQVAAKELYDYLYPMVIKIVKSRRPWRSAEEDLTQEVYKKVFTRIKQYMGQVPFHHWVSRIAVSTCIDHLRAQRRRPEYRFADLSETEADTIESNLCSESSDNYPSTFDNVEIVHKIINLLNPNDQLIVKLVDLEQKSYAEVASILGIKVGNVKVKVFRARQKMQKLYAEMKESDFKS